MRRMIGGDRVKMSRMIFTMGWLALTRTRRI
jgi:hypothetical protein